VVPIAARAVDRTVDELADTLREAREIAANRRGAYPFDEAGKTRLTGRLFGAKALLDALAKRGEVTASEAGLLADIANELAGAVSAFRPTGRESVSCYSPRPLPDEKKLSLTRLEARLPLLEKLGRDGKLRPEVVRAALASVERDLRQLEVLGPPIVFPREDQARAERVRVRVGARVDELRLKLGDRKLTGGLEDSRDWRALEEVWALIVPPLAGDRRASFIGRPSGAYWAAQEAAKRLKAARRLTADEAELIAAQAKHLNVMPEPAGIALRQEERLPLLRKLAAARDPKPLVLRLVLAVEEADLATLQKADLATLPDDVRRSVEKKRTAAATVIARLKERQPAPR
jgi:hypothetical protein